MELKDELKAKSVKELRMMMNSETYDLQKKAAVITEYRLRIPYCSVCGNKCHVFKRVEYSDKTEEIVCADCYRLVCDEGFESI